MDTRFSKFTSAGENDFPLPETLNKLEGADEFLDLLNKVKGAAASVSATSSEQEEEKTAEDAPVPLNVKLYSFDDIDQVIQMAQLIGSLYHGANTLYRDNNSDGIYILALTQSEHTKNEFNKVCNMLSEYGSPEKVSTTILAFLEEHCEIVIAADAVQKLAHLS